MQRQTKFSETRTPRVAVARVFDEKYIQQLENPDVLATHNLYSLRVVQKYEKHSGDKTSKGFVYIKRGRFISDAGRSS